MIKKENDKVETIYSDQLVDRLAELKEEEVRLKSRRRMSFVAVSAGSLSTSVTAFIYVLFEALSPSFNTILPLLVALLGALLAIFFMFFRQRDMENEKLEREIYHLDSGKMRLLREWIAFENLSRKIAVAGSRSNEHLNLSKIIEYLYSSGLIGEIDKGILVASLKSRNEIVHTGESGLFPSEEYLLQERLSHINEILFMKLRGGTDGDN